VRDDLNWRGVGGPMHAAPRFVQRLEAWLGPKWRWAVVGALIGLGLFCTAFLTLDYLVRHR
jgi:hypothetical protein